MYTPDSSVIDTHINHEALKLLSFYALIASLAPKSKLYNPNGVPNQSPKSDLSSPPLNDAPTIRVTVDASTKIMGHGNTIHLPSQATTDERINSLVGIAFRRLPDKVTNPEDDDDEEESYMAPLPTNVEIKVNVGVNICGSKNVVLLGGAAPKVAGSLQGQTSKRKAEVVSPLFLGISKLLQDPTNLRLGSGKHARGEEDCYRPMTNPGNGTVRLLRARDLTWETRPQSV